MTGQPKTNPHGVDMDALKAAAFELSPDPSLVVDADGSLVAVNEAAEALFGQGLGLLARGRFRAALPHGSAMVSLLDRALENLIGNAWKYSARVSHALIEIGRTSVDGRDAFFVRDNGAGFDMRAADRLFGLFQRLHSAKDFAGTGVGLASVRRILRRHGGDIWAESEVGKGARFYFTLA